MIPEQLAREGQELAAEGYAVDVVEAEGWATVVFHGYPLPFGYNRSATELLLKLPLSYPNGAPDMFWVEPDVTLAGGQVPQSAEVMEQALGRQWRRFSWHPQKWNPGRDTLRTYLEFVNLRLARAM